MESISPAGQTLVSPSSKGHLGISQDSGIMANALQPLPQTQEQNSNALNPPEVDVETVDQTRHIAFSRPDESLATEELSAGFTFGKPIPIKPWLYDRPTKQGPITTLSSESRSTQAAKGSSVGEHQSQMAIDVHDDSHTLSHIPADKPMAACSSEPLQAAAKPPHTDKGSGVLGRAFPPLPSKNPLRVPSVQAEPIVRPTGPAVSGMACQQESLVHENLATKVNKSPDKRGPKKQTASRQGNPSRSRGHGVSHGRRPASELRRKLSSKGPSPRPSREHERRLAYHDGQLPVNRPLREESARESPATPSHRSRSTTFESNISRKSNISKKVTYSRSRGALPHPTASAIRREILSSTPEPSGQRTFNDLLTNNAFFMNAAIAKNQELEAKVESIRRFSRNLVDDFERSIVQYDARVEAQEQQIAQISEDRSTLKQQLDDKTSELDNRSSTIRELEEKGRTYRDFMNEAIAEQQALYKATKDNFQKAVDELRLENSRSKVLDDQHKTKAEAMQEQMRQRIAHATSEFRQAESDLREKLNTHDQQLKERDADLAREKNTTGKLLQQLDDHKAHQESLVEIQGQTKMIAQKLCGLESRQQEEEACTRDAQAALLAPIIERLDDLTKQVKTQPEGLSEWIQTNDQAASKIYEKLDEVANAQSKTSSAAVQLSKQLEEHMQAVWSCVEENNVALKQDLQDRKLENAVLTTVMEEKDDELVLLSMQFEEVTKHANEQENQILDLEAKMAEMSNAPREDPAVSKELVTLQEEKRQLQEQLDSTAANASQLEVILRQKEQDSATVSEKSKADALEFARILHERSEAAQTAKSEAVGVAVREAISDLEKTTEDMQKRVDQAEGDRDGIAKQLHDAERAVSELQEKHRSDATTIGTLQSNLLRAESKAATLAEQGQQKATEQEEAALQNKATIEKLQQKLGDSQQNVARITEEVQAHDKMAQDLIDVLKQRANDGDGAGSEDIQQHDDDGQDSVEDGPPRPQKLEVLVQMIKSMFQLEKGRNDEVISSQASTTSRSRDRSKLDRGHSAPPPQFNEDPTDREVSRTLNNPYHLLPATSAADIWDRTRRVICQSPAGELILPTPPTVAQERQRRREGSQPKGIMRRVTGIPMGEETPESERQRLLRMSQTPGSGIFGHGIISQSVATTTHRLGESIETVGSDELQPTSRKRTRPTPDSTAQKKAKIQPSPLGVNNVAEREASVPPTPKNRASSLKTYGSKSASGTKPSSQIASYHVAPRRPRNAVIQDSQDQGIGDGQLNNFIVVAT